MSKIHPYLILFTLTLCLVLLGVNACGFTFPATTGTTTKLNSTSSLTYASKISYRAQLEGKDFIKLLYPKAFTTTTIYTSSSIIQSPMLSPKGELLSFGEWVGENNLFTFRIINQDGFDQKQIADNIQVESLLAQAKWSFDEQLLAYRASYNRLEPSEAKMFVINVTTSEVICEVSNAWAFEWSPVENVIAYIPWQDQQAGIDLVKVDGCDSQPSLFFNDQLTSFNPILSWSPDGKRIAFAGRAIQENLTEIILVDIQSGEQKELTNATANNYTSREIHDLEWSPDGNYILFRSTSQKQNDDIKGRNDLLIANVETGQERKLAEQISYPVWSPDSETIAFATKSDDEENEQIHKVEISTGNVTKLTNTPGNKEFLSWK